MAHPLIRRGCAALAVGTVLVTGACSGNTDTAEKPTTTDAPTTTAAKAADPAAGAVSELTDAVSSDMFDIADALAEASDVAAGTDVVRKARDIAFDADSVLRDIDIDDAELAEAVNTYMDVIAESITTFDAFTTSDPATLDDAAHLAVIDAIADIINANADLAWAAAVVDGADESNAPSTAVLTEDQVLEITSDGTATVDIGVPPAGAICSTEAIEAPEPAATLSTAWRTTSHIIDQRTRLFSTAADAEAWMDAYSADAESCDETPSGGVIESAGDNGEGTYVIEFTDDGAPSTAALRQKGNAVYSVAVQPDTGALDDPSQVARIVAQLAVVAAEDNHGN